MTVHKKLLLVLLLKIKSFQPFQFDDLGIYYNEETLAHYTDALSRAGKKAPITVKSDTEQCPKKNAANPAIPYFEGHPPMKT